jgi:hypothetical protein
VIAFPLIEGRQFIYFIFNQLLKYLKPDQLYMQAEIFLSCIAKFIQKDLPKMDLGSQRLLVSACKKLFIPVEKNRLQLDSLPYFLTYKTHLNFGRDCIIVSLLLRTNFDSF